MSERFVRPAGAEFHANEIVSGPQQRPDVAALAGGGYVSAWESAPFDDAILQGVYVRLHAADGTPVSGDIFAGAAQDFANVSVDGLADGSFVVAWERSNPVPGDPDRESRDIVARHYSGDGTPLDGEFVVAQQAVAEIDGDGTRYVEETDPHVAGLPGGGYIVSWQTNSEWVPDQETGFGIGAWTDGVRAQRFDAADAPQWDTPLPLNETGEDDQRDPEIVPSSDGGFLAAWTTATGASFGTLFRDVDARIFDVDGTPRTSDFRVNTFTENGQHEHASARLSDGGFVVVWASQGQDRDEGDLDEWGVFGQRFAGDGTPVGTEFRVNATVEGNQVDPAVAATADGGFAVAWFDTVGDDEVVAQVFDSDGAPLGGEVPVEDFPDSVTQGTHLRPAMASGPDGTVALVWEFESRTINPFESSDGIFGRVLDTSMTGFTDPVLVDLPSPLTVAENATGEILRAVARDADGDAVAFALSGPDAAAFAIDGTSGALRFADPPDHEAPADADGDNAYEIEIVADDGFGGVDSQAVTIAVADVNEAPAAPALSSATVDENEPANTVVGILSSSDPDGDAVTFSLEDDAGGRFAIAGDRLRTTGPLDFEAEESHAVTVRASDGALFQDATFTIAVVDDPADDSLGGSGRDNFMGTRRDDVFDGEGGDDVMRGRGGEDTLSGGAGDDAVVGGGGDDVLAGGPGNDLVRGSRGADTLSGDGWSDTMRGGNGDDVMSGGNGDDDMEGGRGNDSIDGERGDDTLDGGNRNDTLDGGAGRDVIEGGRGRDAMTGGGGSDVFVFDGPAGLDTIADFALGRDVIDLSAQDITFDEVGIRSIDDGAATRIRHESGWVELEGIAAADVTADLFLF